MGAWEGRQICTPLAVYVTKRSRCSRVKNWLLGLPGKAVLSPESTITSAWSIYGLNVETLAQTIRELSTKVHFVITVVTDSQYLYGNMATIGNFVSSKESTENITSGL